jgi:hypothetical protein
MNKTLLSTALLALAGFANSASAADTALLFPVQDRSVESLARDAHSSRAWKVSLAPVIAGQALDVASSYGMRELNPVMASRDGRFGMKGTTIKIGATAAILGVEYLIVRKNPSSSRILSKLNWAAGFVTIGFAAHNFAIK